MLYDITRPITPRLAGWPGDTPFSAHWVMRIADGASVNVSALTLSAHLGTHADAPYHFAEDSPRLDEMPLDAYLGPAQVVELDVLGPISPEHLVHLELAAIQRLLVKTPASQRPDDRWDDDFAHLAVETAELLALAGVRLFGTDAPSVDFATSKTLDAHHALRRGNVAILEGLMLAHVPPGRYELIALPLKVALDGGPVRAVLRTLD
jgi:arylformamidase